MSDLWGWCERVGKDLQRGIVVPSPVDLEGLKRKGIGTHFTEDEDRAYDFADPTDTSYAGVGGSEGHVGLIFSGEGGDDPGHVDPTAGKDFHPCGHCGAGSGEPCADNCYAAQNYPGERDLFDEAETKLKPGAPLRVHNIEMISGDGALQDEPYADYSDSPQMFHAAVEADVAEDIIRLAGPRRRFNQDWQQVGFDYMPVDAVAHYMQRKEEGFGDEKAPLYELNKQPPLSEQVKQRGYEKPVHLVTDGRSGSIYDGHHRIDIAKQLGHSHVPVEVSWRTPHPGEPEGMYGNKIEPWLKGWLTDMRGGRETVGRRIAAPLQDPRAVADRLRELNHRHMIHRSRRPVPDRVIAEHPPLSEREDQERQRLSDMRDSLRDRWNNMDPMTEQEKAQHKVFFPMDHRYDDLDSMTDREKARHYSDLSNPLFMSGGRTKREQSQYERLTPWADNYFGGMHEQAQHELNRWQDYHDKGYHWNGNFSLEGSEDAHEPHNTVDWGAEFTRNTYDRTPIRDKMPIEHFRELAAVAREHHAALKELAQHGPLYYNPDRNSKPYAHEYADDTRNRLRVELQHKNVFSVPDISQLSKITNPKEMHADDDVVNPRHQYGIAPHGGYRTEAEQRAYKINCQRCILAAEARHRGYNVEAQRNFQPFKDVDGHPDNDQTFDDHQIASWFQNKDGSTPTWNDPEDDPGAAVKEPIPNDDGDQRYLWDYMHDQIKSWGPGARGVVAVTYKSKGGQTKRHVLSAKVHDDGNVHYYDTQTHETGQDKYWRDKIDYEGSNPDFANARYDARNSTGVWSSSGATRRLNRHYSPLRFMRLDDKDLAPHVSQHMVDRGTAPDTGILPTVVDS